MATVIAFSDEEGGGPITVDQDNPLPVEVVLAQGPRHDTKSQSVVQAINSAFALKAPDATAYYGAPKVYASQAAEASVSPAVLQVGPGVLYSLDGYNAKAGAQFILVFDTATAPANGDIPIFAMTAATVANFSRDFGVYGLRFQKGLAVSNSSTVATRTVGSADCQFFLRFK